MHGQDGHKIAKDCDIYVAAPIIITMSEIQIHSKIRRRRSTHYFYYHKFYELTTSTVPPYSSNSAVAGEK